MSWYLRGLAVVLLLGGLTFTAGFAREFKNGEEKFRIAQMRRDRNPGNMLFESQFGMAQGRRIFLIYSGAGSLLVGVVGASLLFGLGSLHAKVDRLPG